MANIKSFLKFLGLSTVIMGWGFNSFAMQPKWTTPQDEMNILDLISSDVDKGNLFDLEQTYGDLIKRLIKSSYMTDIGMAETKGQRSYAQDLETRVGKYDDSKNATKEVQEAQKNKLLNFIALLKGKLEKAKNPQNRGIKLNIEKMAKELAQKREAIKKQKAATKPQEMPAPAKPQPAPQPKVVVRQPPTRPSQPKQPEIKKRAKRIPVTLAPISIEEQVVGLHYVLEKAKEIADAADNAQRLTKLLDEKGESIRVNTALALVHLQPYLEKISVHGRSVWDLLTNEIPGKLGYVTKFVNATDNENLQAIKTSYTQLSTFLMPVIDQLRSQAKVTVADKIDKLNLILEKAKEVEGRADEPYWLNMYPKMVSMLFNWPINYLNYLAPELKKMPGVQGRSVWDDLASKIPGKEGYIPVMIMAIESRDPAFIKSSYKELADFIQSLKSMLEKESAAQPTKIVQPATKQAAAPVAKQPAVEVKAKKEIAAFKAIPDLKKFMQENCPLIDKELSARSKITYPNFIKKWPEENGAFIYFVYQEIIDAYNPQEYATWKYKILKELELLWNTIGEKSDLNTMDKAYVRAAIQQKYKSNPFYTVTVPQLDNKRFLEIWIDANQQTKDQAIQFLSKNIVAALNAQENVKYYQGLLQDVKRFIEAHKEEISPDVLSRVQSQIQDIESKVTVPAKPAIVTKPEVKVATEAELAKAEVPKKESEIWQEKAEKYKQKQSGTSSLTPQEIVTIGNDPDQQKMIYVSHALKDLEALREELPSAFRATYSGYLENTIKPKIYEFYQAVHQDPLNKMALVNAVVASMVDFYMPAEKIAKEIAEYYKERGK
jgi:hypothetical protein